MFLIILFVRNNLFRTEKFFYIFVLFDITQKMIFYMF